MNSQSERELRCQAERDGLADLIGELVEVNGPGLSTLSSLGH
ncbi:hypothetical protein [Nocardioides sp. L-11A]|nr:hypothetical protein QJ852_23490 [Nocardioides sp. L-11A]